MTALLAADSVVAGYGDVLVVHGPADAEAD